MKIGNTNVTSFRLGEVTPSKAYLGTTEVWTAVAPTAPSAVRNVAAVTSETQQSAALISWDAPESDGGAAIMGYNVYYSEDGASTWTLGENDVQGNPFTLVVPYRGGNMVYIRVTAVNAVGEGAVDLQQQPYVTLSDGLPSAPRNFQATAVAGWNINLGWDNPLAQSPGASGFDISYIAPAGNEQVVRSYTPANSYTIGSFEMDYSGQELAIRVRHFNSLGDGEWSDYAYATPADVPGVSDSAYASTSTLNPGAVSVSLLIPNGNGSPVSTVQIQAALNDSFSSIVEEYEGPFNIDGAYTSVEITGLSGGVTYFFRARFANTIGYGGWTTATMSASASASAPGQVTDFSVTSDAINQEWDFSWTEPNGGGGAGLSVVIQESPFNYEWLAETGMIEHYPALATGSYSVAAAVTNETRYFRIRYSNSVGDAAWSNVPSGYLEESSVPGAGTVTSAYYQNGQTVVNWTYPASGSADITVITVYIDGVAETPANIMSGTHYFNANYIGASATVTFTNATGEGPASDPVTVLGAPDAPDYTQISILRDYNANRFDINWVPPADNGSAITGFDVEWRDESNYAVTLININSYQTNALLNSPNEGQSISARVRAYNAIGTGEWSEWSDPEMFVGFPNNPDTVSLSDAGPGEINVSWGAPSNASNLGPDWTYKLVYSNDGFSSVTEVADISNATTEYLVTGLTRGTQYAFRVSAVNERGESNYSENSITVAAGVPDSPYVYSASYSALDSKLYLSVEAPADNGAAITEYYVYFDGTFAYSNASANPNAPITDATNRVNTYVSVSAVNSAGEGQQSESILVSDADFVPTAPDAPTISFGAATWNGSITSVNFAPGASDGGSGITGYTFYFNETEVSPYTVGPPAEFNGNFALQYVTMTATNAFGTSLASSPSIMVLDISGLNLTGDSDYFGAGTQENPYTGSTQGKEVFQVGSAGYIYYTLAADIADSNSAADLYLQLDNETIRYEEIDGAQTWTGSFEVSADSLFGFNGNNLSNPVFTVYFVPSN